MSNTKLEQKIEIPSGRKKFTLIKKKDQKVVISEKRPNESVPKDPNELTKNRGSDKSIISTLSNVSVIPPIPSIPGKPALPAEHVVHAILQLIAASLYASVNDSIPINKSEEFIRALHRTVKKEFRLEPLPEIGIFKYLKKFKINLKKFHFQNSITGNPFCIDRIGRDRWNLYDDPDTKDSTLIVIPFKMQETALNMWEISDEDEDSSLIPIPDEMKEAALSAMDIRNTIEPISLVETTEANILPQKSSIHLKEFYNKAILPILLTDTREKFLRRLTHILNDGLTSIPHPPNTTGRAPPVNVEMFGSSVNNLGLLESDVDLSIIDPTYSSNHPYSNMNVVGKILRKFYSKIIVISRARVPIIKFYDSKSGLECDINFNYALGISNSSLLASYTFLDPRVRPLVMLVKYFVKCRNINDASKNTISSYAWSLMVLAFLQNRGILKNLQQEYQGPRQLITVRETGLISRRSRLKEIHHLKYRSVDVSFQYAPKVNFQSHEIDWLSSDGVANLFLEFLDFFANKHSYNPQNAVSIKDGGIKILPAIDDKLLVVLDPFENDRNCTKMVDDVGLKVIRKELKAATKHLKMGKIEFVFKAIKPSYFNKNG